MFGVSLTSRRLCDCVGLTGWVVESQRQTVTRGGTVGKKRLEEMTLAELWQLFPIALVPPDPRWSDWYAHEHRELVALLGDQVVLHHIGSTSVPGLVAKPIIDILAETAPGADLAAIVQTLVAHGWLVMNRDGPRVDLNKGYTPDGFAERVFHLHIVPWGCRDEVDFRDWLITHPDTAAEYAALKQSLAEPFRHDRDGYTTAKTNFVRAVTAQAQVSRPRLPGTAGPEA
jgi:GrpB-like predicted nucleotidyltransferase (UPF0157 family)